LTPEIILDGGDRYGLFNKGNYPNDAFDDNLVNADVQVMRQYSNDTWVSWCIITGRSNLEDGDEVFIKYGRDYWCYLGNINTLNAETRAKCMKYYNILESDLFDCLTEEDEDDDPIMGHKARAAFIDKRNREGDKLPRAVCSSTDSPRKVRALQRKAEAEHRAANKKATK